MKDELMNLQNEESQLIEVFQSMTQANDMDSDNGSFTIKLQASVE